MRHVPLLVNKNPPPEVLVPEQERPVFNDRFARSLTPINQLREMIERYVGLEESLDPEDMKRIVNSVRLYDRDYDDKRVYSLRFFQMVIFAYQQRLLEPYMAPKRYIMSLKTLEEQALYLEHHAARFRDLYQKMVAHTQNIAGRIQGQQAPQQPPPPQPPQGPQGPPAQFQPEQRAPTEHNLQPSQPVTQMQPPPPNNVPQPTSEDVNDASTPRPPSTQPTSVATRNIGSHEAQISPVGPSSTSSPQRPGATTPAPAPAPSPQPVGVSSPPTVTTTRGAASKRGAATKRGAAPKRKGSFRATAATAPTPVPIDDETPTPAATPAPPAAATSTSNVPSPSGGAGKRTRPDEMPTEPSASFVTEEPSPKRHKVEAGETPRVVPAPVPDDLAMATAVSAAMESIESAAAFREAATMDYNSYGGGSTLQDEMTLGDLGDINAPSLNELLQRVQTQVASTQSEGLISSLGAGSSVSPWLQIEPDSVYLGLPGTGMQSFNSSDSLASLATQHDSAFDISDYIYGLTYDEPDDGSSMRITATPDLVHGTSSHDGITPTSVLESPAGPTGARPLEASPKGLRESAPNADRPIGYGYDFYKEINVSEGPHFHRGADWTWDGETAASEWPVSYDDRIVSSTA